MRVLIIAATVLVGPWAAFSFPAQAEPICGPAAEVIVRLAEDFGETPVFAGRHPSEPRRMVLTLNAESGTWSVVVDDGATACVTAAGIAGVAAPPAPGEGA